MCWYACCCFLYWARSCWTAWLSVQPSSKRGSPRQLKAVSTLSALLLCQLLWTCRSGCRRTWNQKTTHAGIMADFIHRIQFVVEHVPVHPDYLGLGHCVSRLRKMHVHFALRHALRADLFHGVFPSMQAEHLNTWPTGTVKLDLQSALEHRNTRRYCRYSAGWVLPPLYCPHVFG